MRRVLVVAPHPDDETLGCGGTLLKHKAQGDAVHWLIATSMTKESGFSDEAIEKRQREIDAVRNRFGFESVHQLGFAAAQLDTVPISSVVRRLGLSSRTCARGWSTYLTAVMCILITASSSAELRHARSGFGFPELSAFLPTRHCQKRSLESTRLPVRLSLMYLWTYQTILMRKLRSCPFTRLSTVSFRFPEASGPSGLSRSSGGARLAPVRQRRSSS